MGHRFAKSKRVLRREEVHFKSVMSRYFFLVAPKPIRYRGIPAWSPVEAEDYNEKPCTGVTLAHFSQLPLS
ncbi:hypothetical protein M2G65_22960, partial [Vibrio vulnificus]|nr:hypothetical protein [Vibrio vulnificus]